MKCKVDGCDRESDYIAQQVCQKHYFRMMRYGTYETTKVGKRQERSQNDRGYQMLHRPDHPLAMANGSVYEHRAVIYEKYGDTLPDCELCGKTLNWKTAHIDHIDEIVTNNHESNLRPLCNNCNTRRSRPPEYMRKDAVAITYLGETKTANEWSRDPRVSVSNGTIMRRKKLGMSDYECLFAPKITHNGNLPVKKPTPPKYTRKNSIAIEWDGEKKTPSEWANDPRVALTDNTIRSRAKAGMSAYDCLFKPASRTGGRKRQMEIAA